MGGLGCRLWHAWIVDRMALDFFRDTRFVRFDTALERQYIAMTMTLNYIFRTRSFLTAVATLRA